MKRRDCVLAMLLTLALLVGCSPNHYTEIHPLDISENLLSELRQLSQQPEGVADFLIGPDGKGFLVATTGADNSLKHHLRLDGGEYDKASKLFTVYATRYIPRIGTGTDISSDDWRMVVQFRKFSFDKLRVVISVEDSDEQIVYELSIGR